MRDEYIVVLLRGAFPWSNKREEIVYIGSEARCREHAERRGEGRVEKYLPSKGYYNPMEDDS